MSTVQIRRNAANFVPGSAGQDVLRLLQRHGPLDLARLQTELGVTRNAVREQLTSLIAAGLVQSKAVRRGVGRPVHVYALTDQAQAQLGHGYDVLLKLLLAEVTQRAGPDMLRSILAGVSDRLAAEYGAQAEAQTLEQRLLALTNAFEAHGTPITLIEDNAQLALHKHSCPYFNVAQADGAVCVIEQQMLEQVLGRNVQIKQRIVDGHAGCRFVIKDDSEARDTETRRQGDQETADA